MKKIHRIIIVVADMDEAVPRYEKLFDTTIVKAGPKLPEMFGVRVAGAWDLGVELLQPVDTKSSALAKDAQDHLDSKGEGIFGVAFHADNMQASVKNVEKQGVAAYGPTFTLPREMLDTDFGGAFTRFEETVFVPSKQMGNFALALVNVDTPTR